MTSPRSIARALFVVLALLALPLHAQLNPNSAWQRSKTDFLDLFQGNRTTGLKPEILLVIDSSGSTGRLMFHPLFPNNWQDENPGGSGLSGSQDISLMFYNSGWPTGTVTAGTGTLTNTLSVGFGNTTTTTAPTAAPTSSFTASGKTYYLYANSGTAASPTWVQSGARSTIKIGSYTYPFNTLIKPDGTEVTADDVATANPTTVAASKTSAIAWMRCASHIRYCVGAVKVGSAITALPVPRYVDVPLTWNPIDATALKSDGTTAVNVPNATWHGLTPTLAMDSSSGVTPYTLYQIDTDTTTTTPALTTYTTASKGVCYFGGFDNISGYLNIRTRYLEWIFVGKDPGSPNNGAYYCIPSALPAQVTFDTQRSIDPTSIVWDGPSDTFNPATGWSYLTETSTPVFPSGAPYNLATGWVTAYNNGLPARTRTQAIKEAVIKSWLKYQTSIMFAYRFLDSTSVSQALTGSAQGSAWTYLNTPSDLSPIASYQSGGGANYSTPLIESWTNAYCQMTNPAAFADQINTAGYTAAQLACQHHFVIFLTDGAPSSSGEGTCFPYAQTTAISCAGSNYVPTPPSGQSGNPTYSGNGAIKANNALVASGGSAWNPATLAGVAAHGGDPGTWTTKTWIKDPTTETFSGSTLSTYLPFWVTKRTTGGVGGTVQTLTTAQPIQTMTVGVSLGVNYYQGSAATTAWTSTYGSTTALQTWNQKAGVGNLRVPLQSDTSASKYRLLAAAYFGDPQSTSYDISTAGPFYLPGNAASKPNDAAYFFDGRDPNSLVQNLDDAFSQATNIAKINATSSPVFPTIGGGLGAEVYLATFLPSGNSGPLWTGDLLMYPTAETTTGTRLISGTGSLISANLDDTNAQWSAAGALSARGWTNRVIYTRMAATSGTANPPLLRVNLGTNGTTTTDAGYTAIKSVLPGASDALKLKNWQFFTGADVGSGGTPLQTRDSIMGDIINSSPAVLEYTTLPSSVNSQSSVLSGAWSGHSGNSPRFRAILVGTNQGFLHCFGEVSWTDTTTNATVPITKGVVDELWAFSPTEALPYIDQLQNSGNLHTFIVDGAPTIYLLDLPQVSGQTTGNGKYDVGSSGSTKEQAIAVFGLGKGGRSYYAINIIDPGAPSMQWSLCPDEPNNYSGRILSGSATTIANMGLSTCTPTIARVTTSLEGKSNQLVDAILLGGGYSDINIEAALPGVPAGPANGTKLGRGVVAINVNSGNILKTWDTSGTTGAGPVSAGVVPFEYAVGSGLNQRAYFTDIYGSLWALGSSAAQGATGGYQNFILDSASIDSWVTRQVYWQQVPISYPNPTAAGNGLVTTLPVPFNIPYFPVVRATAPTISPSAVGIAFVTGDRNNPLDSMTYLGWQKPAQHRLNVLFDRQDNLNNILTSGSPLSAGNLMDASTGTAASFSSTSSTYFLKPAQGYYGYYINFPSLTSNGGTFVPKGIVSPLLLDGALFYSVFSPTTTSCAGGAGLTDTYRICNVMQPTVNVAASWSATNANSVTTPINNCSSGKVLEWTGVASILALRSVLAGVQAGMTGGSGVNINASQPQNLVLQDLTVQGTGAFSKIRVWRVVH